MHLRRIKREFKSEWSRVDWSGMGRLEGPGGGYILHTRVMVGLEREPGVKWTGRGGNSHLEGC